MIDISCAKKLEPVFLQKARRAGYVCPICRNGTGPDGDGLVRWEGDDRYRCRVCGWKGDVIDLYGLAFGISDPAERLRSFKRYYGLLEGFDSPGDEGRKDGSRSTAGNAGTEGPGRQKGAPKPYGDYIKTAARNNDPGILEARGISAETQEHFSVGYDPEWRNPRTVERFESEGRDISQVPASPRVIIPRSQFGYLARDARADIPAGQKRYSKQSAGIVTLFNGEALHDGEAVIITEGEIDAMSVYEAGFRRVTALCSTANTGMLVRYFSEHPERRPMCLLMMDNDKSGQQASERLKRELARIGVPGRDVRYSGSDPNDGLVRNRERFTAEIRLAYEAATSLASRPAGALAKTLRGSGRARVMIKTGFKCFDRPEAGTDGGLSEGLYVIGGMPGEGKTTLCLQACDQAAQNGSRVLYISTEQKRMNLVGKSVSRETLAVSQRTGHGTALARTSRQLSVGSYYDGYDDEELAVINEAEDDYFEWGDRVTIVDTGDVPGGQRMTVGFIEDTVAENVRLTGERPLVVVDYIQNLVSDKPGLSDRKAVDDIVHRLKETADRHHIPVIAISSLGRSGYNEPIGMDDFKESGGIEFSADVLYGLQPAGMNALKGLGGEARRGAAEKVRGENERKRNGGDMAEMEFVCLKQREGEVFTARLGFIAKYNCFVELGDGQ